VTDEGEEETKTPEYLKKYMQLLRLAVLHCGST
jgi:hypothetical protein